MKQFKPMLAVAIEDISTLKFPMYASVKLDGIRCIVKDGVCLSRSLKPIPNKFVQERFGKPEYEGFDGELILGNPSDADVYRKTNSAVMSIDGTPDVILYVFDDVSLPPETPYADRVKHLEYRLTTFADKTVQLVYPYGVDNIEDLIEYENLVLEQGYEGLMLRTIDGKYKYGRSTLKEGYLLKLKRFSDSEAIIVGFEELMHNDNIATVNELGNTSRSSCKDNLVPAGTLGALIVQDCETKIMFKIGTGFDAFTRSEIWDNREKYKNAIVKYKHFEVGVKVAPRFPVFLGFRDKIDM